MASEPHAPSPLQEALDRGYVLIGRIVKAHGIKGEVKVQPFSGSPENFLAYKAVVITAPPAGQKRTLGIIRSRSQARMVIVQFGGVETRQTAEALVGQDLWLHKDDFPALGAGEYYWFQFEGMRVLTEEGRELGHVAGLLDTAAHDLLVVKSQGREYLVPVRDEFISRVDFEQRLLIVSHVPGLLELNG